MSKLAALNWAYSDEIFAKRHKTYKASRNWKMAVRHGNRIAGNKIPAVAKRLTKLQLDKMHKNILK